MSYTYTNRKGKTYYLHSKLGKTGKPRYYFSRSAGENTAESLPDGYEVRENVNGQVSIGKARPRVITQEEEQLVLRKLKDVKPAYRLEVKGKAIITFEADSRADEIMDVLSRFLAPGVADNKRPIVEEFVTNTSRYNPVLKFELADAKKRTFEVYRMTYRGEGGWSYCMGHGKLGDLAERYLPVLGTDEFFDLM